MKILYSHRTRSADGQHVHIRALTEAMRARGHEVFIAGPGVGQRDKPHAAKPLRARENAMRRRMPAALYECAEYAYSFYAHRRLRQMAMQVRPDVIYERYNLFFHAGVWLKEKTGLPLLLEVNAPLAEERAAHGGLRLRAFAERSERTIWRAADCVLPVSQALAEKVRAAGVSDDKAVVIPNGVGEDFLRLRDGARTRARYGLAGKTVLGFAGFMRPWHGLDRALRFVAETARPDLHLLLVGDGPARRDLEALAAALGVADCVTFAGVVQRDAMPDALAAFDIALQPAAVSYASPLKLFEYMAQGKAIVAPDQPNVREALGDNETAALFAPDAPGAFHRALFGLIDDAPRRARLGGAARARLISEEFTWAAAARRVETIASALLENRK